MGQGEFSGKSGIRRSKGLGSTLPAIPISREVDELAMVESETVKPIQAGH
jgi:hypothetical protein